MSNPHGITSYLTLCVTDLRNYIANAKRKRKKEKQLELGVQGSIRVVLAQLSLAEAI